MPGHSIAQVQQMADAQGINGCKQFLSETMIRTIQLARNEEPCFATDKRHDCAEICEWRRDCRKLMAAWLR